MLRRRRRRVPLLPPLQVKQEIDLPSWVAYIASIISFGGGLLGISYGIVSGECGIGVGGWGYAPGGDAALPCATPITLPRRLPAPPPPGNDSIKDTCARPPARPPPPRPVAASWDPRREGSLLGWTEFQANVPLLMDRFRSGDDSKN